MKKLTFLMLLVFNCLNSPAQQLVVELFYNVNGYPHCALCVFEEGRHGKCNVKSPSGNCWFDAVFEKEGEGFVITMSNPSVYNWIPGTCHLNSSIPFVEFYGNRFGLEFRVVSGRECSIKKAQYGFRIAETVFGSDRPVIVKGASCEHNGCRCRAYKGIQTSSGSYSGKCTNSDGWGHTCNHSPREHGL